MRYIIIHLIIFVNCFSLPPAKGVLQLVKKQNENVLICVSKTAYAYHKGNCQGIKKCTHEVFKITKDEAIKRGKSRAVIAIKGYIA